MSGGEWTTQSGAEAARIRCPRIDPGSKAPAPDSLGGLLLAGAESPCGDSVLAWLSENRQEASKIGANRWNLETLPELVAKQSQLRKAEAFQDVLARASISHQTLTAEEVLKAGGFPQSDPVENVKAAQLTPKPQRKDAGIARKR
jgi:hypothetical protein